MHIPAKPKLHITLKLFVIFSYDALLYKNFSYHFALKDGYDDHHQMGCKYYHFALKDKYDDNQMGCK